MSEKDGGPAFPRPKWWPSDGDPDHDGHPQGGMSLRDYFAGQVISKSAEVNTEPARAAKDAYQIADAMIEARKAQN